MINDRPFTFLYMNYISIYVHWPFCLALCPYCDFNSHLLTEVNYKEWLIAYRKELDFFAEKIANKKVRSIFFGGGTPSLMEPKLIEGIIQKISSLGQVDKSTEITLEANPTSFEINKFKDFKKAGINRVSLGIQSLNDRSLKILGRKHDAAEAVHAIDTVSSLFERYSFDLIYALPHQRLKDWRLELTAAIKLAGGHISLYQLTVEKGTPFFKLYKNGELQLPSNDIAAEMYEYTTDRLGRQGYSNYEISNYSKIGRECLHNLCYWNYDEYIGIGPGAHSRIHNTNNVEAIMMTHKPQNWLNQVALHGSGIQTRNNLSQSELIEEIIMMGTRLKSGVDKNNFAIKSKKDFNQFLNHEATRLYSNAGFIVNSRRKLALTDKGLLLHSYIVPRLIA